MRIEVQIFCIPREDARDWGLVFLPGPHDYHVICLEGGRSRPSEHSQCFPRPDVLKNTRKPYMTGCQRTKTITKLKCDHIMVRDNQSKNTNEDTNEDVNVDDGHCD